MHGLQPLRRSAFLAVLLLLTIIQNTEAEQWQVNWAQRFGGDVAESSYSTAVDAAGNVFLAGFFNSSTIRFGDITLTNSNGGAPNNSFLAKFTPAGEVLWATHGVGIGENSAYSVAVDAAGNACIAGRFLSPTLTFGHLTITNRGSSQPIEAFVAKFDANGNTLWLKGAGGPGADTGWAVAADPAGNCYFTGWFRDASAVFDQVTLTNKGTFDLFIAKYDPQGNVLWAKNGGANSDEQPKGVAVDRFGNVYVTGRFDGATIWGGTTFNTAGSYDFILLKFDSNGQELWAKSFGGSHLDYGSSVAIDSADNILVTGYFESPSLDFGGTQLTNSQTASAEVFTAKFNPAGEVLWVKTLHGTSDDEGRTVAVDPFDNVYVTGSFQSSILQLAGSTLTNRGTTATSDAFVIKYDRYGNQLWAGSYGGTGVDFARGIAILGSDNVAVSGQFTGTGFFDDIELSSTGGVDAWLMLLQADTFLAGPQFPPDFVWARQISGPSPDTSSRIGADALGNLYVSGNTEGNISFGPTNLTGNGSLDVHFAKYDRDGTFQWARRLGGTGSDATGAMVIDRANSVYVSGYFSSTIGLDGHSVSSTGDIDIFILKMDPAGSVQWLKRAGGSDGDHSLSLEVDGKNNLVVGGYFRNTATFDSISVSAVPGCSGSRSDAFVAKYDPNGHALWVATGGGCHDDVTYAVAPDVDGNIFAVGYFRTNAVFGGTNLTSAGTDDAFVARYSAEGNLNWIRRAGGASSDKATEVAVDADGNVYATGFFLSSSMSFGTTNLTLRGNQDIFLAKYSRAGILLWVKHIGGSSAEDPTTLLIDSNGRIYLSGKFEGTTFLDNTALTSRGSSDVFLACYNTTGALQWATQFGAGLPDMGGRLALDGTGDLYMGGQFEIGTRLGSDSFVSAGAQDAFVGRLSQNFMQSWPQLEIIGSEENLYISWPSRFPNHTLQQSGGLGNAWTPMSGAVLIGDRKLVVTPRTGQQRFFRLVWNP